MNAPNLVAAESRPGIIFVPYEPAHLKDLVLQPPQAALAEYMRGEGYAEAVACGGQTTTAFDAQGRVLGIAGLLPQNPARAVAWALLADRPGGHLLAMTRRARAGIEQGLKTYDRIETFVDPEWPAAVLWVRALGFDHPVRLPCYFPGRRAAVMFTRYAPGAVP